MSSKPLFYIDTHIEFFMAYVKQKGAGGEHEDQEGRGRTGAPRRQGLLLSRTQPFS